jgi:hypothetical protein
MLGHLLLEDLLEDGLDAFPDPGLHVPFHGFLNLFLLGQVSPSSLNLQLTRHYLSVNVPTLPLHPYVTTDVVVLSPSFCNSLFYALYFSL